MKDKINYISTSKNRHIFKVKKNMLVLSQIKPLKTFNCPVQIMNEKTGKTINAIGVIDTGSNNTTISINTIERLGLVPLDGVVYELLDVKDKETINAYEILLNMLDISKIIKVKAGNAPLYSDIDILIGLDVLSLGELNIKMNKDGLYILTFRIDDID